MCNAAPDPRYRMTLRRREWLSKLVAAPQPDPVKGRTARDCNILSWACYAYRDLASDDIISADDARERYGQEIDDWWPNVERYGEMITKWGRDALCDK